MTKLVGDDLRIAYREIRRLSGFDNWEDSGRVSDTDNPAVVDRLLREIGNPRIYMRWQPSFITSGWPFEIYPADVDDVTATIGTVTIGGVREQTFTEAVRYRASSGAALRFPGAQSVEVLQKSPFLVLNEEPAGEIVTVGPLTRVSFEIEDDTLYALVDGVRRTVVGTVTIRYTVRYLEAEYFPADVDIGLQYGTIVATLGTTAEILDVDPPRLERPNQWVEIYRVVSTVIVDGNGRWEKPPGWPEDNSYPNRPTVTGPDPDASMDIERVHEYGYCSWIGQTTRETYHHRIEQPYVGSFFYRPQYLWRQTDAASIPESHLRGFLRHVDLPLLKAGAENRWKGLE